MSTDERSRVALARCKTYEPEAVREALRSVLAPFGGMQRFVRPGARVILKPNYVQGRPAERAANTRLLACCSRAVMRRVSRSMRVSAPSRPNT